MTTEEKNSLPEGHILLFLLTLIFLLLQSNLASAERPFLFTERAVPVERGTYRLEAGLALNRISSGRRLTVFSANLRYGMIQNLEFDLDLPYLFLEEAGEHENQVGDLLLKTKVRFLKGREANPLSIAGQMVVKLPSAGRDTFFGTTGEADVGFLAIASKEFTPVTAHINFGYFFIGNPPLEDRTDQLRYSLGLEFKTAAETAAIVGEIFGGTEVGSAASNGDLSLLGGVVYQADQDVALDASIGFGLTNDTPDYIMNFGFSYAFH